MKPLIIILALFASNASAETTGEPDEEAKEQKKIDEVFTLQKSDREAASHIAFEGCVVPGHVIVALSQGTSEPAMYMDWLRSAARQCGKTFADLGIGPNELLRFKQNSCAVRARLQYKRNAGGDPVGEEVYLRIFKAKLNKCGLSRSEAELYSCRFAKSTKYRTDGLCEKLAGVTK